MTTITAAGTDTAASTDTAVAPRTGAPAFTRYPVGRAVAVAADAAVLDRMLDALEAAGIDLGEVHTMTGREGRASLDRDGRHHGWFARMHRVLTHALLSGTDDVLVQYDAVLASGASLISVPRRPRGAPRDLDVASLLLRGGAPSVREFTRWTVQLVLG